MSQLIAIRAPKHHITSNKTTSKPDCHLNIGKAIK